MKKGHLYAGSVCIIHKKVGSTPETEMKTDTLTLFITGFDSF